MTTLTEKKSIDPIQNLSIRLKELDKNLSKNLKKYIPDWWDDELVKSESAVQQVLISLARFANLDIQTVLDNTTPLQFKDCVCNYKHATNKEQYELKPATALIASVSKIAHQVNIKKYKSISDALAIRTKLLDDNPCVNFEALINFCWNQGIPVLYLPELPTSKKMDAVVVDVDGQPVISITKKCRYESEFLFLLAHEMGHIFHQHLKFGQLLVDEKIDDNLADLDEQEKQANLFAVRLLTERDSGFHSNGKWLKSEKLAEDAKSLGEQLKIDTGHIILNWAHTETRKAKNSNLWGIAYRALNITYPHSEWQKTIHELFLTNIDESEAQGDQLDYLYKLMNIEE